MAVVMVMMVFIFGWCRAPEMREELQAAMDELFEARYQERQVQLTGRADYHSTSCPSWK